MRTVLIVIIYLLLMVHTASAQTTNPDPTEPPIKPVISSTDNAPQILEPQFRIINFIPSIGIKDSNLIWSIQPGLELYGTNAGINWRTSVFVFLDQNLLDQIDFGLAGGLSTITRNRFRYIENGWEIYASLSARLYLNSKLTFAIPIIEQVPLVLTIEASRTRGSVIQGTEGQFVLSSRLTIPINLETPIYAMVSLTVQPFLIVRGVGLGGAFGGGVRVLLDQNVFGLFNVSPGLELTYIQSYSTSVRQGFSLSFVLGGK